jgi:hypothetical protein
VFRAALPIHERLLQAYVNRDRAFLDECIKRSDKKLPPPALRTPIDLITRELQTWGHLALYDVEKVGHMLTQAGYVNFSETAFDERYDPPTLGHRQTSFYVTAYKPS